MTTFRCLSCDGVWTEGRATAYREPGTCRYCLTELLKSARNWVQDTPLRSRIKAVAPPTPRPKEG